VPAGEQARGLERQRRRRDARRARRAARRLGQRQRRLDFDAAPLEVKTVSGDVQLRGTGRAATSRVTTVSGDLRIERGAGVLEVTTVSGDLALALGGLRSLRLRTTSGDVRCVARPSAARASRRSRSAATSG
jgi:hypothetical protein